MNVKEEGVNGLGKGVINTNSQEFKFLQNVINQKSQELSDKEKYQNAILSIKLRMYAYLNEKEGKLIEVGQFLNELIKSIHIKKKTFADFIETKESNLSALFNGNRRINADLALKLGEIFNIEPNVWINIQTKNDILKIRKEKKYHHYSLNTLLEKDRL